MSSECHWIVRNPVFVQQRGFRDYTVIGFSILGVSRFKKEKPLETELAF
jgi:hypothetical protein